MQKFLSFLLTNLIVFTSANAYVPGHLQETLAEIEVETAILLGADGTFRCWIGKRPEERLTDFDTLEECDENDELYARMVLGVEEIQMGGVPIPFGSKVGTLATGVNKMIRSRPVISGTFLNFLTMGFGGCYAHHGDNQKKSAIVLGFVIGSANLLYATVFKLATMKVLLSMAGGGGLSVSTIDFVCADAN